MWRNFEQINNFCNTLGTQIESSVSQINQVNTVIVDLIYPFMEQVFYNASDVKILVQEHMLQQGDLVDLKSFFCLESSMLKNKIELLQTALASHIRQLENQIATIESDSSHYAEVIGQLEELENSRTTSLLPPPRPPE